MSARRFRAIGGLTVVLLALAALPTLLAAEGLRLRKARGSCVIVDYLSGAGSHPYREVACIVTGRSHTDLFIAAAFQGNWQIVSGTLERAASSLIQR
jgi:hypothetical protein